MMSWTNELTEIFHAGRVHGVDPLFLAAIRKAENGAEGREFGILSVPAPSYEAQVSIAAKTVRNRLYMFPKNPFVMLMSMERDHNNRRARRLCYNGDFINFLAKTWAPIGVANDPTNLNQHWVTNVRDWYYRFVDEGVEIGAV